MGCPRLRVGPPSPATPEHTQTSGPERARPSKDAAVPSRHSRGSRTSGSPSGQSRNVAGAARVSLPDARRGRPSRSTQVARGRETPRCQGSAFRNRGPRAPSLAPAIVPALCRPAEVQGQGPGDTGSPFPPAASSPPGPSVPRGAQAREPAIHLQESGLRDGPGPEPMRPAAPLATVDTRPEAWERGVHNAGCRASSAPHHLVSSSVDGPTRSTGRAVPGKPASRGGAPAHLPEASLAGVKWPPLRHRHVSDTWWLVAVTAGSHLPPHLPQGLFSKVRGLQPEEPGAVGVVSLLWGLEGGEVQS